MEGEINKSCGLDIHKRFFIATILSRSGEIQQQRFDRDDNGILNLKNWVTSEECDVVACESTSDFSSGDKLASWLGIVPNVYQSADKFYNGRITKRGSKVARWILTQIAQAAARKKNSKLKEFFNRKKKSIGHAKAIIALARKIATIIWHLITNDEMYEDETGYEKGEIQKRKIVETEIFSVDERIKIISGIIAIMGKKDGEST